VLVAIGLLIAVAILKPWPADTPAGSSAPPSGAPRAAADAGSPTPVAPADRDRGLVAPFCFEPTGWRLFANERFAGRLVRSWKSIMPVTVADGPDDTRIPFLLEASRSVLTLGYCAPIDGPEGPPGPTTTTIYREVGDRLAGTGGVQWETVSAPRIAPQERSSRFGGVWGPPRSAPAGGPAGVSPNPLDRGWPSGTYVFAIEGAGGGGDAFQRWFGVVVENLPAPLP
jgi:hypothetical protein